MSILIQIHGYPWLSFSMYQKFALLLEGSYNRFTWITAHLQTTHAYTICIRFSNMHGVGTLKKLLDWYTKIVFPHSISIQHSAGLVYRSCFPTIYNNSAQCWIGIQELFSHNLYQSSTVLKELYILTGIETQQLFRRMFVTLKKF